MSLIKHYALLYTVYIASLETHIIPGVEPQQGQVRPPGELDAPKDGGKIKEEPLRTPVE